MNDSARLVRTAAAVIATALPALLAAACGGSAGNHAAQHASTTGSGGGSGAGGPINVNTATLDQLDSLPGIGPTLAQRIIDYREQHGPFRSVEDLLNVSGIGDARLADLKPLVTV